MRKMITIAALMLAVFNIAAATKVQVIFRQNLTCDVVAHFNHEDNVIISLNATKGSPQTLDFVNLAGEYPVENASSILSLVNATSSHRIYKFKYWNARFDSKACILHLNQTLTCKFKLSSILTNQSTSLYFSMQTPDSSNPNVTIVGSDYNNKTRDHQIIDLVNVAGTKYYIDLVFLSLEGKGDTSKVRNFTWADGSQRPCPHGWDDCPQDPTLSEMMQNLRPVFVGFQCAHANKTTFNVLRKWTGEDNLDKEPSANLEAFGLPVVGDFLYSCNVTVVFTERNTEHSLIPVTDFSLSWIQGRPVPVNASVSANRTVIFRTDSKNVSYTFDVQLNRQVSDEVFITFHGLEHSNTTRPVMKIETFPVTYALKYPSLVFSEVNQSQSSITYKFDYLSVPRRQGPCAVVPGSVTCRFSLTIPGLAQTTSLFITVADSRNGTSLNIVGSGYNNVTSDRHVIDTAENQIAQKLKNSVSLKLITNSSDPALKYIEVNASDAESYEIVTKHIVPKFIDFGCYGVSAKGADFTVLSRWPGSSPLTALTAINITELGLPTHVSYTCEGALVFTEKSNEHSLLTIYFRNTLNFDASKYKPHQSRVQKFENMIFHHQPSVLENKIRQNIHSLLRSQA